MSGRGSTQQHRAAAPATISASALTSILGLASVPLTYALRGAAAPAAPDRTAALERVDRMRALDTQRLAEKVAKGDADEEQVEAMVKELSRHVKTSAAAIHMMAHERRGKVELELAQQLAWKAAARQREREQEALVHEALLARQAEERAREATAAAAAGATRVRVQQSLREQLAEREYAKMCAEEARAQEGELMLAQQRREAAAAEAARQAKREAAARAAHETAQANEMFAARDARRREAAAAEEAEIVEYMRAKEARERAAEAAAAGERAAKDALEARLSAAQKRAADISAGEDEARARRHVEARVLAERARAREEEAARVRAREECKEALALQLALKAQRAAAAARAEAEEADAIRAHAAVVLAREEAGTARARASAAQAMADLRAQKHEAERAAALEKRRPLEERRRQKLAEVAQERVVANFKAELVGRMTAEGLPLNYVAGVKKVPNGLL